MGRDSGGRHHGVIAFVGVGVPAVVGTLVLLLLWYGMYDTAQNISSGGPAYFSGVAWVIAVPAFELGLVLGIFGASLEWDRSPWQLLRRMARLTWILAGLDYVLFVWMHPY